MTAKDVKAALDKLGNMQKAQFAARFFKTGEGQYGAGDIFIGVTVPEVRNVAKDFKNLSLGEIEMLLESPIHEHRLAALVIMTEKAKKADAKLQKDLYDLYLRRTDRINNWDLVDLSCRDVVGRYLMNEPRDILYTLAKSKDIWERRIAVVSTWAFIRAGQVGDTFSISELLLHDSHDLIHKAVGWMLRSAGDKNRGLLEDFLDQHAYEMPRTMLRYAIEHFPPAQRQSILQMKHKST